MSKERNLPLKESTLRRLELQSVSVEPKDSSKTIKVLIKSLRKDQSVVQIDQTNVIRQSRHHELHDPSELNWLGALARPITVS